MSASTSQTASGGPQPGNCTCGQCIDGYLSHAMQLRLLSHFYADTQPMEMGHLKAGQHSALDGSFFEEHFSREVRQRSTKTFLNGIVAVLHAISYCLEKKIAPYPPRIAVALRVCPKISYFESSGYNGPFQSQGGRITNVLGFILKVAQEQSPLGDDTFVEAHWDALDKVPKCRNDLEFDLVQRSLEIPRKDYLGYGYYDEDGGYDSEAEEDDRMDAIFRRAENGLPLLPVLPNPPTSNVQQCRREETVSEILALFDSNLPKQDSVEKSDDVADVYEDSDEDEDVYEDTDEDADVEAKVQGVLDDTRPLPAPSRMTGSGDVSGGSSSAVHKRSRDETSVSDIPAGSGQTKRARRM